MSSNLSTWLVLACPCVGCPLANLGQLRLVEEIFAGLWRLNSTQIDQLGCSCVLVAGQAARFLMPPLSTHFALRLALRCYHPGRLSLGRLKVHLTAAEIL